MKLQWSEIDVKVQLLTKCSPELGRVRCRPRSCASSCVQGIPIVCAAYSDGLTLQTPLAGVISEKETLLREAWERFLL